MSTKEAREALEFVEGFAWVGHEEDSSRSDYDDDERGLNRNLAILEAALDELDARRALDFDVSALRIYATTYAKPDSHPITTRAALRLLNADWLRRRSVTHNAGERDG